ncbi:MAG: UDP-N-acetylmuramoyl-L-alanyl-D-glutamate--2,6-diaminopimelate ligase [Clostridia bacterium]|nr:UDP-N-acetylmuramoyl-L-alanyl-D-glutamate--2,6-diaminopimelate ligase [Clostridia bacterium]
MKLYHLIEDAENKGLSEKELELEIFKITSDLAEVEEGSLFFAIKGFQFDGNDFLEEAIEKGAAAVVTENKDFESDCCVVAVKNSRRALAYAANVFFDKPSEKLCIIGITGTNGKTTTSYMLTHILSEAGIKCGIIGTNGVVIGDKFEPLQNTTPDAVTIHSIFAEMVRQGITHVVMEVSSHALDQDRAWGIRFKIGIFTNLSIEHLDYHGTMEEYAKSKLKLFKQSDICVINKDDSFSDFFVGSEKEKSSVFTYSAHADSDYRVENIHVFDDGSKFDVVKCNCFTVIGVKQKINGFFNVYNALAAFAAADILGVKKDSISRAISTFSGVKGRMERILTDRGFTVIIDYAHTPDGLGKVLTSIRSCCKGKILAVFGCGGNRDKSKRSLMGKIAEALSDKVIVTSDNPRNEEPEKIIEDILVGIKDTSKVLSVTDRREAIRLALSLAKKNDTVLLAGKGHETYQIINGIKHHFDEREEIENFLKNN